MRYKVYIVLLSAVAVAAAIAALCGVGGGWIAGLCVAIVVLTLLLSRSVIVPMNAVRNGMYLLREQAAVCARPASPMPTTWSNCTTALSTR